MTTHLGYVREMKTPKDIREVQSTALIITQCNQQVYLSSYGHWKRKNSYTRYAILANCKKCFNNSIIHLRYKTNQPTLCGLETDLEDSTQQIFCVPIKFGYEEHWNYCNRCLELLPLYEIKEASLW